MSDKESIFLESGLLEQYALDLCNPVEMMEVEQMLKSSAAVRIKYKELQDNLETLAKVKAVHPPEEIRSKIMDFLNEEEIEEDTPILSMNEQFEAKEESSSGGGSILKLAAGIALLISLGLLFQQWNSNQELMAEKNALEDEIETLKNDLGGMQDQISSIQETMTFINNAETKKVRLIKAEENDLKLIAYWNETEDKAILDLSNIPTPPQGKCYQLWADVHGEMLSVAVISGASDDMVAAQYYEDAESLNITLEDAPGSDHATVTALVTSASV